MADEDGLPHDRPAATRDTSNQPPPQTRPASTKHESASNSTPKPAPTNSPQQLPAAPPAKASLLESHPMTTSSSSSSIPPDQPMETTGASPYGTRSRNRTGNARPNYAEDRELDAEFEWSFSKKGPSASNASLPNGSHLGAAEKASSATTRRSSTSATHAVTANNNSAIPPVPNSNIPGMSSFSAYPDPNIPSGPVAPSRKRKAPGSSSLPSQTPQTATQPAPSTESRRSGLAPQARRLKATNLMSFDNCQGYLKNGKLKADDGTILAVNGTFHDFFTPCGLSFIINVHLLIRLRSSISDLRAAWGTLLSGPYNGILTCRQQSQCPC